MLIAIRRNGVAKTKERKKKTAKKGRGPAKEATMSAERKILPD